MVRIAEHETHRLPAVKQPPCEVAWVGRGSRGGRQAGPQQFENQSIAVKPRERIPFSSTAPSMLDIKPGLV